MLDASYFKPGDVVTVRWYKFWIQGRVIGCTESPEYRRRTRLFEEFHNEGIFRGVFAIDQPDESSKYEIRVALNQPFDARILWRFRFYDTGIPMYEGFAPEYLRLEAHDPDWDPFTIEPYATASVNREFGAYLSGAHYEAGDPVWAWEENDWRAAIVVNVGRWISVRYLNDFQDRKGNRSKSYRTWQIWPVISESSAVFKKHLDELQLARRSWS